MRKRTKRSEGAVLWTPQGENPEQRAMQSTSSLGAFTAMNLGVAYDTRKEIESLRAQVSTLHDNLQKATEKCTIMETRAEWEQNEHKVVITENEELKKKVKDLQSDLEASKLSRLDT